MTLAGAPITQDGSGHSFSDRSSLTLTVDQEMAANDSR